MIKVEQRITNSHDSNVNIITTFPIIFGNVDSATIFIKENYSVDDNLTSTKIVDYSDNEPVFEITKYFLLHHNEK